MYVILGGGVTGLCILECLKQSGVNAKLITQDIGGQVAHTYVNGPRILHYTDKTEIFMQRLGIKGYETFLIGYVHDGGMVDDEFTDVERRNYFYKTRGTAEPFQESCLSGGKNILYGWDWARIDLVNRLYDANISSIKAGVRITSDMIRKYQDEGHTIISTINYNILCSIMYWEMIETGLDQNYFVKSGLDFDTFDFMREYAYIYDLRSDSKVKRIMPLNDKLAIFEFVTGATIDDINETLLKPYEYERQLVQIRHELRFKELKGIVLEGRYAQMDHSYKLNTVIDKYLEV